MNISPSHVYILRGREQERKKESEQKIMPKPVCTIRISRWWTNWMSGRYIETSFPFKLHQLMILYAFFSMIFAFLTIFLLASTSSLFAHFRFRFIVTWCALSALTISIQPMLSTTTGGLFLCIERWMFISIPLFRNRPVCVLSTTVTQPKTQSNMDWTGICNVCVCVCLI